MRSVVISLLSVILLIGCGGDDEAAKYSLDKSAVEENNAFAKTASAQGRRFGIGDVEAGMRLETILSNSALSGTVLQQVSKTKLEFTARAEAKVAFPYPRELELQVTTKSVIDYPEHSSRITVNVYVDDTIVHTHKFIAGKTAKRDKNIELINIMPLIDLAKSDTALIHSRAEIEFFPNTLEENVTLEMDALPTTVRATKVSNPLRITFVP